MAKRYSWTRYGCNEKEFLSKVIILKRLQNMELIVFGLQKFLLGKGYIGKWRYFLKSCLAWTDARMEKELEKAEEISLEYGYQTATVHLQHMRDLILVNRLIDCKKPQQY